MEYTQKPSADVKEVAELQEIIDTGVERERELTTKVASLENQIAGMKADAARHILNESTLSKTSLELAKITKKYDNQKIMTDLTTRKLQQSRDDLASAQKKVTELDSSLDQARLKLKLYQARNVDVNEIELLRKIVQQKHGKDILKEECCKTSIQFAKQATKTRMQISFAVMLAFSPKESREELLSIYVEMEEDLKMLKMHQQELGLKIQSVESMEVACLGSFNPETPHKGTFTPKHSSSKLKSEEVDHENVTIGSQDTSDSEFDDDVEDFSEETSRKLFESSSDYPAITKKALDHDASEEEEDEDQTVEEREGSDDSKKLTKKDETIVLSSDTEKSKSGISEAADEYYEDGEENIEPEPVDKNLSVNLRSEKPADDTPPPTDESLPPGQVIEDPVPATKQNLTVGHVEIPVPIAPVALIDQVPSLLEIATTPSKKVVTFKLPQTPSRKLTKIIEKKIFKPYPIPSQLLTANDYGKKTYKKLIRRPHVPVPVKKCLLYSYRIVQSQEDLQREQNSILDQSLNESVSLAAANNSVADKPVSPKRNKYGFPTYAVNWADTKRHLKLYNTTMSELCHEMLLRYVKTEEILTKEGRLAAVAALKLVQTECDDRRVMTSRHGALLCSTDAYGKGIYMSKFDWTCRICGVRHKGDIFKYNKCKVRVANPDDDLNFQPVGTGKTVN